MLWALASSAFVIYLYRKLNAEDALETSNSESEGALSSRTAATGHLSAVDAEFAKLSERIGALESRLSKV